MKAIHSHLVHLCTQKPLWVYGILLLITLAFGSQIPRIQIDTDPENMLSAEHPSRVFHNQVKREFAMYDAIVVGVVSREADSSIYTPRSLADVHALTDFILQQEGVVAADVMSLSTVDNIRQAGEGTIRFEWMMDKPPASQEQATYIQTQLQRLPLLYDTLVAQSGKAAAIYVPIIDKNQSYRIAEAIRAQIGQMQALDSWYITGLPVAEDQFGFEMFVQMGISAPLAGLTIFVLMFMFFRNIPLIIAPMVVAMATVIIIMGALIGMGFTVHIMSSMIAIFLMPIAVVDSVHMLSEFADRYKPGENAGEVIDKVVEHLFTPMLYTSITSSIGFFSLMLTPIPPVQIFGAFVGSGILLAFLITITFVPAYIGRMNDSALTKLQAVLHDNATGPSRVARFARGLGQLANQRQGMLLTGFAVVFAVSVWGITQIQINDNPVRWFKPNHEIRVADRVLNENFAGTYNAYLVFEDVSKGVDALALLADAGMPPSLASWQQETTAKVAASASNEQMQSLLMAIDDRLFADNNDEELAFLEAMMARVEEANSLAKRFQSPQLLAYIEKLQVYLQQSGLVGKSNSLADVVKVVNRELRSGDAADYRLPETAPGVAQTLLQYQSSHRPNDLWHFVTPDYRKSLLWLQLTSGDNQDMTAVIELVSAYTQQNPLPQDIHLGWAGKAYLNVVWQDNMVSGMLDSLLGAFVIVFVMMIVLFRSFIFGILAMLPLTLTISLIYGLIGIVGKDYDMPIAVLSALTLGLSVDFAIHFLERARETFRQTQDVKKTMQFMFDEPASAITRNALVIAFGFTPLLFAPLVPYITVGIFLASIMAISALVTLLLLPAVMVKAQRWVFPRG